MERLLQIQDMGYNIQYIWEAQWRDAIAKAKRSAYTMDCKHPTDVHILAVIYLNQL